MLLVKKKKGTWDRILCIGGDSGERAGLDRQGLDRQLSREHLWHKYEDQSLDLRTQVQAGLLSLVPVTPTLGGRDRKVSGAEAHMSYKLRKKSLCQPNRAGNASRRHPKSFFGFCVFLNTQIQSIQVKILMLWSLNTENLKNFQAVSQILSFGIRV